MSYEGVTAELATHATKAWIEKESPSWRRRVASRIRYQLAGGLVSAVAAPILLRGLIFGDFGGEITFRNSALASVWAMLAGYLIVRKMTAYPGVRASAFILPCFLATFGLTMAALLALRIDYSRFQVFSSFLLTTAFFSAAFAFARGNLTLVLQVAPFGDLRDLKSLRCAEWRYVPAAELVDRNYPLVVDFRATLSETWERLIADRALQGLPIYDARHVFESLSGRVKIHHLSENTFDSLIPNSIYATAKRQIDLLLAVVALVLLSPFMLLIAVLIRVDSDGPALFQQQRMGYRGRPFTVFKFRTMKQGAEKIGINAAMTESDDPRITRFGRLLRRTRIDELPQILNILKGDMSWIGPRPEALLLSRIYEAKLPYYTYRHIVRPGISGWAQVNQGHVTSVSDVEHKLQYDFFYAKNFSFWLDLLVVLKTVKVMVTGRGAK